jgi:hypothetical protein
VEERLLLDRIALHAADVAPGDIERAAAVEAHLADASGAVGKGTRVAAGDTANASRVERADQFAGPDGRVEHVLEGHPTIVRRLTIAD